MAMSLPSKKIRQTGTTQILQKEISRKKIRYCGTKTAVKDRISSLPDSIQTHILNSLPIKDAFRTSVLSKNWRHICNSLPSMALWNNAKSQMNGVIDHVLGNYNVPSIDTLQIIVDASAPAPQNQTDEWFSFAVSHHVQTFVFWDFSSSKLLYPVPSNVFSCASLESLYLKNVNIIFPTDNFFLPRLKCVILSDSRLTNAVFTPSSYPMLEKLIIASCQYKALSLSSSTLYSLQIQNSVGNPKINLLSNPSLTNIHYREIHPPNISLETLSSLQEAYFVINHKHLRSWDLVSKMLKGLRSVKELSVGAFYVESIRVNWGHRLLGYPLSPFFIGLSCLKIVFSGKIHIPVLKVLLRSCPNLVLLNTWCEARTIEDDTNTAQYWEEKEKESLPTNFLNSLVTYERDYNGKEDKDGFEMMKFIVENATALRNINITVTEVDINEENVRHELKTFLGERVLQLNVVISRLSN